MKDDKQYQDNTCVSQNCQPDQSNDLKIKNIGAIKPIRIMINITAILWAMFWLNSLIIVLEYLNIINEKLIIPNICSIKEIITISSIFIMFLITSISSIIIFPPVILFIFHHFLKRFSAFTAIISRFYLSQHPVYPDISFGRRRTNRSLTSGCGIRCINLNVILYYHSPYVVKFVVDIKNIVKMKYLIILDNFYPYNDEYSIARVHPYSMKAADRGS